MHACFHAYLIYRGLGSKAKDARRCARSRCARLESRDATTCWVNYGTGSRSSLFRSYRTASGRRRDSLQLHTTRQQQLGIPLRRRHRGAMAPKKERDDALNDFVSAPARWSPRVVLNRPPRGRVPPCRAQRYSRTCSTRSSWTSCCSRTRRSRAPSRCAIYVIRGTLPLPRCGVFRG